MKSWTTKNGITITKIVIGFTNCFLVQKADFAILVDSGKSKNIEKYITKLKFLLNGKEEIDYLIITHTHFDHCTHAALFAKLFTPKVIVHRTEAGFLSNGFKPLPRGTLWLIDKLTALGNKYSAHKYTFKPLNADIYIDEGYEFTEKDLNIKIISTPGHTIGSMSVIVDDEIALVGDAMSGDLKFTIFPPFADDKMNLVKSWGKLLETDCKIFIPGHGGIVKREAVQKYYLKYRE
jgi:hydroxyacylglutathione hydrolase